MTENLFCLSRIRNGDNFVPKSSTWQATVADFLLHENTYNESKPTDHRFRNFSPSKPNLFRKSLLTKEEKMTEARRLLRQERFQYLGRDKQDRVIKHELMQIKEGLANCRLLQKMELDNMEEESYLQKRRRELREGTSKMKTATIPGYPRFYRSPNDLFRSLGINPVLSINRKNYRKSFPETSTTDFNQKDFEDPLQINLPHKQRQENSKILSPKYSDNPPCNYTANLEENRLEQGLLNEIINQEITAENVENFQNLTPKRPKSGKVTSRSIKTNDISIQEDKKRSTEEFDRKIRLIKKYFDKKIKMNYFSKWKELAGVQKVEKLDVNTRQEKIDMFMKRLNLFLQEKKEKQIQQSMVANGSRRKTAPVLSTNKSGKQNLNEPSMNKEERDKDLHDIADAVYKSTAEVKRKLRTKSVLNLDPSLKGKVKLIRAYTAVIKKEEIAEEPQILDFPQPAILLAMDQKQKERQERLNELKERKRLIEEEKDRLAKEKLQRHMMAVEEERRRKLREFREKVKKERLEQERRKEECLRLRTMMIKASQFYRNKLLTKYGFSPWMQIMSMRRDQCIIADKQNDRRLKRILIDNWKTAITIIKAEKERKAILFWRRRLLMVCFNSWSNLLVKRHIQYQVSEDWYDYWIVRSSFHKWQTYLFVEQFQADENWSKAVAHHRRKKMVKHLKQWMLLPQVMYLEREKEQRRQELRQKVQQVLPDYKPAHYYDN